MIVLILINSRWLQQQIRFFHTKLVKSSCINPVCLLRLRIHTTLLPKAYNKKRLRCASTKTELRVMQIDTLVAF